MAFNDAYRRKYIEEPQLEHYEGPQTLENPPKQRTVQQQEKQNNLVKQERRELGEDSYRSRSSSRRERRKRVKQQLEDGRHMKTGSLAALEEADANGDMEEMRPFERIGPDSTSMDGPVTLARALRGEIPMRGANPKQPYWNDPNADKKGVSRPIESNIDSASALDVGFALYLPLSLVHITAFAIMFAVRSHSLSFVSSHFATRSCYILFQLAVQCCLPARLPIYIIADAPFLYSERAQRHRGPQTQPRGKS